MKDDGLDLLKMNDLQLLALSVHRHLILLKNAAEILGSPSLLREADRNVNVCASILGSRLIAAQNRSAIDRQKLQKRVKVFQDLLLDKYYDFDEPFN